MAQAKKTYKDKQEIKEPIQEIEKADDEIVCLLKNGVTVYRKYSELQSYLKMGWIEV
jgi:hypothetical protein